MKAVMFDLDGTLLNRHQSLRNFIKDQYQRWFDIFGHISEQRFTERFIALDNNGYVWKDKVYRSLLDEFNVNGVKWEDLLDDYLVNFQVHAISYPNAIETLKQLENMGMKLALVTNGRTAFQMDNIRSLNLVNYFDSILISEEEGVKKPDAIIFRRAALRLGVSPEHCLFVGDDPVKDIDGAKKVGMSTIWKKNNHIKEPVASDWIIDELDELLELLPI